MNQAAFHAFYEQTSKKLWAYLLRICGEVEIAKDILQESYLRFLEKPPQKQDFPAMQSYLYTIATRLNLDRLKRHRRWQFRFVDRDEGANEDPQGTAGLRVDMATIFKQLTAQERALLWLAYVEEQTHRTIAEILGLREKSVRVVLHRARQKLVKILNEYKIDKKVFYEDATM